MQNHIVVACDKFMGAHKHLPVFGIFNYVHCTLSCGGMGIRLVPQAKLVIGKIHHRCMGFGGAHFWKTIHPQAMGIPIAPPLALDVPKCLYHLGVMHKKRTCLLKCTHTWFSLHMVTSCSCSQTMPNPHNNMAHLITIK